MRIMQHIKKVILDMLHATNKYLSSPPTLYYVTNKNILLLVILQCKRDLYKQIKVVLLLFSTYFRLEAAQLLAR